MPRACAPIPTRPPSSVFIATLKPWPSSPSSALAGMRQLVKYSGGVLDPRIPSLCSASPTENPGVSRSTMNALIPRVPAAVGSVLAKTM